MTDYEVYYDPAARKWVVEQVGVGDVEKASTKKKAVKRAQGSAQQKANRSHRTQEIDIYTQKNIYQKTETVSPTH